MTKKDEEAKRKSALHTLRECERESIQKSLPVPQTMLKSLFDYVDERLSSSECDHTLRFAREFIQANGLPQDPIVVWLEEAGGHCDCEAIGNAEEVLEGALHRFRRPSR